MKKRISIFFFLLLLLDFCTSWLLSSLVAFQNFRALHFEIWNLKFHKFGNYFVRKPDLNLERCSWLKYAINLLVCAPDHPKLKFHIKLARDGSSTIKYILYIFFQKSLFSTNMKVKLHTIQNCVQSWKKMLNTIVELNFMIFWIFYKTIDHPSTN